MSPVQKWKTTIQEISEMEKITHRIRNKETEHYTHSDELTEIFENLDIDPNSQWMHGKYETL